MKRLLPNLVLLLLSVALAGAACEWILRLRLGTPPAWTVPQEAYVPDPELGYSLAPGQRAFTHDRRVAINADGMRDREYPRAPGPGVRRLLALGDSQTFGNGVDAEDTWPEQLERRLSLRGRWEVVNAGLAGSNTWQHERLLERWLAIHGPDGVVLGFYVNDVVPIPPDPGPSAAAGERSNTWSQRWIYRLKRSALFNALWGARHGVSAWLAGESGPSWEDRILTGAPDETVEAGWRQVESSLARMKALADARGVTLWVLAIPRRDQVSGAQPALDYQRRLAQTAARLGIPLVDPLPALREAYAEHGAALFIPWDGHHTGLANGVLADVLARAIAPAG